MQRARHLVLALALIALPGSAFAQMMGGHGPGGPGPGMGGGELALGPVHGGGLVIAPDGKALVIERGRTTSGGATTVTTTLTAISANGTKAWSYNAASDIHRVVATDGIVVLSLGGERDSSTRTVTSQLVALNLTTGVQAWTLSIDGSIGALEGVTGGILVEVIKVTPASGGTAATVSRTLQFVTTAGAVSWTISLNG